MESTRIRFMTSALWASGCMFTVAPLAPMVGPGFNWAAWTAFGLIAVAGVLGWRAYRLWGQWLAEHETQDNDGTRE